MLEVNNITETTIGFIHKNWKIHELNKLTEAIIDCLHEKKPEFIDKSNYIYLEVFNIGNYGFLDLSNINYVNSYDYKNWVKRIIPKSRDIIITKTGRVGATAILPSGINFCIGRNQVLIRTKKEILLPEFLLLYFQSQVFQRELSRLTTDGTILKSLHVKYISQIKLPVPPLSEQTIISKLLYGLLQKIKLNHQMNKTLEQMAQTIFKSWFVDFEPFRDPEHEWYVGEEGFEYNEDLEKSIPNDWIAVTLIDLFKLKRGHDISKKERINGPFPVLGSRDIIYYNNQYKMAGPGVITGKSGNIGTAFFVHDNFWPSASTLYIEEYYKVSPYYAYFLIQKLNFKRFNVGSAQPIVNRNHVHKLNVVLAPMLILDSFNKIAKNIFDKIHNNLKQIKTLHQFRDLLLPQLISGKLRIPDPEKFLEEFNNDL